MSWAFREKKSAARWRCACGSSGARGGYFCRPDQGMPWPEEHIQALHDAADELGRYPLGPDLLDLEPM